jgi:hypothetical protein
MKKTKNLPTKIREEPNIYLDEYWILLIDWFIVDHLIDRSGKIL